MVLYVLGLLSHIEVQVHLVPGHLKYSILGAEKILYRVMKLKNSIAVKSRESGSILSRNILNFSSFAITFWPT